MPVPITMAQGPLSVGIIMDGNRRWAKERGQSSLDGHEAGARLLLTLLDEYRAIRDEWGTAHYIFYAFSTENWSRTQEEVANLLGIFERAFKSIEERLPKLLEDGVRVRFIGDRSRFSPQLQALMRGVEEKTKEGTRGTIAIAVSYGGQADILQASSRLLKEGKKEMSAEDLSSVLWTHGIPAPDLIIRTGGEHRLSNFLTWESVYSELFFIDTLWPDFSRAELEKIFTDFRTRERRHGK